MKNIKNMAGLFAAWAGAALLAVAVATTAVGSVRTQISDEPTSIGAPPPVLTTTDVATLTATTATPATTPQTVSTAATPSSDTTSATVPETTTTTSVEMAYTKTYDTEGGSVHIMVEGFSVSLVTATGKPGWRVEVDNYGPKVVEVKFERNEGESESEIEFVAVMDSGELHVTIVEE